MTDIETRISQGLNNAIDRIKPDMLNRILNSTESGDRKAINNRKIQIFKIGIAFAMVFLIVIASRLVIVQKGVNSRNNVNSLFITGLNGYKSQISLPNCQLYFNEAKASTATMNGLAFSESVPLYSESDIIKQFGFDPLVNLWMPVGFKSCFCTKSDEKWYYNYAYLFSANDLYWLNSIYRTNPNDYTSKTITISLSHKTPMASDIEPTGEVKISQIYNTKVTITHQPKGINKDYTNEMFMAKFTYKNVGYNIIASNGVSQVEFINVVTSIIRS